ncbi:MAG TPA: hypothetical protein VLA95_06375 [Gemmatimonadales bacterium]|nr:hypothetical protein [Gemmatimonadales bacterium]
MRRITLAVTVACGLAVAACNDGGNGTGPDGRSQVSLSLVTEPPAAPGLSLDQTVTVGEDVLVLSTAQLVLKEIEFERAESSSDCSDDLPDGDDDCEELEVGPILVDLPLGTGVAQEFMVAVDTGHYDELEFVIHKPEDDGDAADVAFLAAHPDFAGVSIRVTGTFNGTPFTYETDLDVEQEHDLVPALVVAESGTTNVTLMVDVSTWFLDEAKTALVDPATANKGGANESIVKENIKQSVEAFEDDDSDGSSDD